MIANKLETRSGEQMGKMNRRGFIGGIAACAGLTGCKVPWWFGEQPKLNIKCINIPS